MTPKQWIELSKSKIPKRNVRITTTNLITSDNPNSGTIFFENFESHLYHRQNTETLFDHYGVVINPLDKNIVIKYDDFRVVKYKCVSHPFDQYKRKDAYLSFLFLENPKEQDLIFVSVDFEFKTNLWNWFKKGK